ncbi:L-2-amino-thiazoline-4-carboxylic acid hydrolase [Longilinea arvoryzae]|uniref:L-2-amino-thiazoline-4-carboxylic acid hydrolase n=1 Tax=Longilinea arvoryzae TaxID=360412 RepID=A0A0S7B7V7_9CHLR|nr:L-2-amino-thiazoline-4-carboxylic acid hydrolase [Longilinea arvoryzae]GAP13503.1 L-2-amino-thiazoline-4-carboxylic acid hydrolase [Longilinea arvoryzae]
MIQKRSSSGLFWAVFGLASGAAIAWLATRPRSMPNLYATQRALAKLHGEVRAGFLAGRIQEKYDQLMAHRPRFSHPALRWHLEGNILPGLATYQVLCDELGDRAAAQSETGHILAANFVPGRKPLWQMLGLLPQPFRLMRPALRWIMRFEFPVEGWETQWVEDNEQRIGMDISRCFYLDVLTTLGAPELTGTFCALDDYDARQMPPGILFERSGTLGRGQTHCDFRYCTPAGRSIDFMNEKQL